VDVDLSGFTWGDGSGAARGSQASFGWRQASGGGRESRVQVSWRQLGAQGSLDLVRVTPLPPFTTAIAGGGRVTARLTSLEVFRRRRVSPSFNGAVWASVGWFSARARWGVDRTALLITPIAHGDTGVISGRLYGLGVGLEYRKGRTRLSAAFVQLIPVTSTAARDPFGFVERVRYQGGGAASFEAAYTF